LERKDIAVEQFVKKETSRFADWGGADSSSDDEIDKN